MKVTLVDPQKTAEINRLQFEHGLSPWVKEAQLTPEIRFWRSHFKPALVNVVTFCNLDEQKAKSKIDAIIQDATKNTYDVSWWVTPFTKPTNLAELLKNKGFTHLMSCKCLVKDLTDPITVVLPQGLEIKRVTTKQQMKDYVQIVASSFGYDQATKDAYLATLLQRDLPSNSMVEEYIAYYNGKPVCTALILVIDDTTTTFYDFATLPEARNKGIGTAMMLFQLKRSQELGAKQEIIIAAPNAQNISKKVGFQESYLLDMYTFKTN